LLGAILVSRLGGRVVTASVVETEAYLGWDDPASHGFRGRRHRGNFGLYSPPGHWYVYRSYGIHWCANVVTGPPGGGAAVLLRGAVVVDGKRVAAARRRFVPWPRLADGPGKLCQALAIDRGLDGTRVRGSPVGLFVGLPPADLRVSGRIGITKAVDWPLRFLVPNANGAAQEPPRADNRENGA